MDKKNEDMLDKDEDMLDKEEDMLDKDEDMLDKQEDMLDKGEEESMEPQMKKMRFKGIDPEVDFDQGLLQGQIQSQAPSSSTKSPVVGGTHESRKLKLILRNRKRRQNKKQRAREV